MTQKVKTCQCGSEPDVQKIGEWPAQYRIVCECGKSSHGEYYGNQEYGFRHSHALASAVRRWNKCEFESEVLKHIEELTDLANLATAQHGVQPNDAASQNSDSGSVGRVIG